MQPVVGVVMPVFNEERWLEAIFYRVLEQDEVAQLVAVDDGSTDRSWRILLDLAKADSRICVLRHETNLGKGKAIQTGLTRIQTAFVLIQDADLEYDPADYPRLLEPLLSNEADVVYGSRFLKSCQSSSTATVEPSRALGPPPNPRWHTLGNRLLTAACNRLTGLSLTDEATCYKVFRKEILDRISLKETGFGFCPEITAKVAKLVQRGDVRLKEVPIRYQGRGISEGKKIRLRDGLNALWCLWHYSREDAS